MTRKLFAPDPITQWNRNAVVGGRHSAPYAYISGYYQAAERLTEAALTSGYKDTLFFPICFNYRHYVELALKHLIMVAEDFHSILEQLGDARGKLSESAKLKIVHVHSLEQLLSWFVERLALVTDTNLSDDVCRIIKQLHHMDPNGQTFRYPFAKDGSLMLPDQRLYDLANIRILMEEVESELSGVDAWLEYNTEQAYEYYKMLQEAAQDSAFEIDF